MNDKPWWDSFRDRIRVANKLFSFMERDKSREHVKKALDKVTINLNDEDTITVDGITYRAEKDNWNKCPRCEQSYSGLQENGLCWSCDLEINRHLHNKIDAYYNKIAKIEDENRELKKENKTMKNKIFLLEQLMCSLGKEEGIDAIKRVLESK